MSLVQILHYYCKPRRANMLNNITYQRGIACQIQTNYLDISDIAKELANKNHVDSIFIDEDLFGLNSAEEIIMKIDVLKYVSNTEIVIIALDKNDDDEVISALKNSGIARLVITKNMKNNFEDIICKYLDDELNHEQDYKADIKEQYEETENIKGETLEDEEIISDEAISNNESIKIENNTEINQHKEENISEEKNNNLPTVSPEYIKTLISKHELVTDAEEKEIEENQITEIQKPNKLITIGVCGLQPHIGVTHHSISMAVALSKNDIKCCYKENNTHDIYHVLEKSSLAVQKQGYIQIVNIDLFDRNTDISYSGKDYSFLIMDFGCINECFKEDFLNTDIPVLICGVKDWEIDKYIGAYTSGILDKVNVLINFFPIKEQNNFAQAFQDIKIYFANYAPEVFEPEENLSVYNSIVKNYIEGVGVNEDIKK